MIDRSDTRQDVADPQLLRRAALAETNSRRVNEAIERDDAEGDEGLFMCEWSRWMLHDDTHRPGGLPDGPLRL